MSGRPRTIDRDKVLDAAEAIVAQTGAAGLTFDAVARAAGITKGGVQYCFGTKDGLIEAMIRRWGDGFERDVLAYAGEDLSPASIIRGHIAAGRESDQDEDKRSAVLMTALLQSPDQVAQTRDWYTSRLAGLDLTDPADRQIALAFLAGEGVFFLKSFGLTDLNEAQWQALFRDILTMAGGDPDKGCRPAPGTNVPD